MTNRPFTLDLNPMKREAAMITECDGVFVIEPMRFITIAEARSKARQTSKQAA